MWMVGAGVLHHCPQDQMITCKQPLICAFPSVPMPEFVLGSSLMAFPICHKALGMKENEAEQRKTEYCQGGGAVANNC